MTFDEKLNAILENVETGKHYVFYYNSFEPDANYDDPAVVAAAASNHGEDQVALYIFPNGLAVQELSFHGRVEDTEFNRDLTDDERIEAQEQMYQFPAVGSGEVDSEVFGEKVKYVTKSEMESLSQKAGLGGVGNLIFRDEEEEETKTCDCGNTISPGEEMCDECKKDAEEEEESDREDELYWRRKGH